MNREVIAELRRLQCGGQPNFPNNGLCKNLSRVGGFAAYKNLPNYFEKLGLRTDPIYYGPEPWQGQQGELRRKLAGLVADLMEGIPPHKEDHGYVLEHGFPL